LLKREEVKETKLVSSSIPGGRKGAAALGVLTLAVTLALFANAVHAALPAADSSSVSVAADSDQGAACTGVGDNQQGECDTQSGDQTGPDSSGGLSAPEGQ
jgi:hypothetical protein